MGKKRAAKNVSKPTGNWRWLAMFLLVLVVVGGVWWNRAKNQKEAASLVDKVKIETEKGVIYMDVYTGKVPMTAKNFVDLVESGFYDGLTWHRVEDWVVQTGDPSTGNTGRTAKTIRLEINSELVHLRGTVGMARTPDPNSASSQFYIIKASDASWLNGDYAVFAQVTEGMDVVDNLEQGDKVIKATLLDETK